MFEKIVIDDFKKFNNKKVVLYANGLVTESEDNIDNLVKKLSEEGLCEYEYTRFVVRTGVDYLHYFVIENGEVLTITDDDVYLFLMREGYHVLNFTIDEEGNYCVINEDIRYGVYDKRMGMDWD